MSDGYWGDASNEAAWDDALLLAHPDLDTRTLTERLLDALGPAMREAAGPELPDFVEALVSELAATDALLITRAGDPGPALVDLARSPHPASIGQLVGVQVPAGLDVEAARRWVTGRGVSRRGTPGALAAAVGAVLTGTRRVDLIERDGSPWRVRVITYASETPDPTALAAAAESERPLGLVLTVEVRRGQSLGQLAARHRTLGALRSQSYAQILTEVPA